VDGAVFRVQALAVPVLDAVGLSVVRDVDDGHVLAHVERALDLARAFRLHRPAQCRAGADDGGAHVVHAQVLLRDDRRLLHVIDRLPSGARAQRKRCGNQDANDFHAFPPFISWSWCDFRSRLYIAQCI
jgi:hypothetical protein